jgi:hypothetical protein
MKDSVVNGTSDSLVVKILVLVPFEHKNQSANRLLVLPLFNEY